MKIDTIAFITFTVLLTFSEKVFGANGNDLIVVDSDSEDTGSDSVNPSEDDDATYEKFVPTKEWQAIRPGQAIPAGLHVRIDLQNKKKEAKLLDESSNGGEDSKFSSSENKAAQQNRFSPDELKEALKLLKDDSSSSEEIKKKFRSIEELKKEFGKINMSVKTEGEILAELVKKYRTGHNKVPILQDLEFLLHQYDLAQDFVKMGGIDLLLPDFNSTESRVRSLVASTLGSAMQGNPRVQIAVLESNTMQHLLRLVSFDESPEVQTRALYALSCLLRNFPAAQKNFVESGGIAALIELFRPQKISSLKLQVKVITLLHDLLSEQHLTERYVEDDKIQQEKLRQYKSFQLETVLKENGFCSLLPKLLSSPDHDTQEKVISAMQTLVSTCWDRFIGSLDSLKSLAENYKLAAVEEVAENESKGNAHSTDSYFLTLYSSVSDLISSVKERYKDEL